MKMRLFTILLRSSLFTFGRAKKKRIPRFLFDQSNENLVSRFILNRENIRYKCKRKEYEQVRLFVD